MSTGQLTFWSEEHLANPFQSPGYEKDWMTRVATWPSDSYSLLTCFVPVGLSGKTSLESCRQQEEGTLAPSSGHWQNSGMGSRTEFWTLNGLESPSVVDVCSLSAILEIGDVPQRYYLSAKACAGILRRAGKRGKELPGQLHQALQAAAGASSDAENPEGKMM